MVGLLNGPEDKGIINAVRYEASRCLSHFTLLLDSYLYFFRKHCLRSTRVQEGV